MVRALVSCLVVALVAGPATAHYNILLPSTAFAKKGEKVTFTHFWGHPYEHELGSVPAIRQLYVITPEGQRVDLTKQVETIKVAGAEGKEVAAHRFTYTPEKRGDYTFVLFTAPAFLEDLKESVVDVVKVVLHVQTQKGWGAVSGEPAELVPVTRPYGLFPGMVFQARAMMPLNPDVAKDKGTKSQPLPGAIVEIERYNAKPTKPNEDDELITFRTQTDALGMLTCTLPDPGWWAVTVTRPAGNYEVNGKEYPIKQRMTIWVHVHDKK